MKKLFFQFLLVSVGLTAMAQNQANEEPYLVKPLSKETIKNVEVKTSGGSIAVTGVNISEARVEVYVRPNNSSDKLTKEEIKSRLDEMYNLDISVAGNKLTAIAKTKNNNTNWKKSLSIAFRVFVPTNITSELTTSGGSISLKNVSGSHDFTTSGGSLHVDNLSGNTRGRTSGGSIHVANSKDNIELTTSGGSIQAENCTGTLRLSTSGGSLKLNSLDGNIEANTSGGSINGSDIKGNLTSNTSGGSIHLSDLACSLETSTSGGSINVAIKEFGKFVKISNSSGNVTLQIPGSKGVDLSLSGQRVSTPSLSNFNGSMDQNQVAGKLNGGGIPVTVRASSGKVNLEVR